MSKDTSAQGSSFRPVFGCLLAAVIYSAALFIIKGSLNVAQWVLYVFTLLSFLLLMLHLVSKGGKKHAAVDAAAGMVAKLYFGLQFMLGGILGMCFDNLSKTVALIGCTLLLMVYLAVAIVAGTTKQSHSVQEKNSREGLNKLRFWESDLLGMAEKQTDFELRKALKDLAEEVHYSDAVSLPGLKEIEMSIERSIALLRLEMSDGASDVHPAIQNISSLMKERNRLAAILKQ